MEFKIFEPEPHVSQSSLPDSEFIFLAYGSPSKHLFLEFVDIADEKGQDLDCQLSDDTGMMGPDLEELGWNGEEFEGLYQIRCRYESFKIEDTPVSMGEWDVKWNEISRERMSTRPWESDDD